MLKEFQKIVKEVKEYNNNEISHYVAIKLASLVLKSTPKNEENVAFDAIDEVIESFWYANKQAKKCSNRETLRKYNFSKISNGEKLLKISQNEVANKYLVEKLGNFYSYVLKHGSAYIPQNNFGRYADYIKFNA